MTGTGKHRKPGRAAVKNPASPAAGHSRKPGKLQVRPAAWIPWLVAAVLVIVTGITYFPALQNGFTNWDDPVYVLDNQFVKKPVMENFAWFFSHPSAFNYHPLTMLSLSMDYHASVKPGPGKADPGELSAFRFHLTSVILHLINVILLFFFIYRLSGKRVVTAAVTAALFALHPMHVESVAWISERKDVLYTLFFVSGLLAYLEYLERRRVAWLFFSGLLFLLSLFSKPAAVVFPLILLAIDYYRKRTFTWSMILEKVPFFILSIIFGMITSRIQGDVSAGNLKVMTFFQPFLLGCYGFMAYQFKLLFPAVLSAFYPYPVGGAVTQLPFVYYLAPVGVLALAGLAWYSSRSSRVVPFGYLFFFFSVILVLQFIPIGSAVIADRYTYLSSVGLFFIVGWYADRLFVSGRKSIRNLRWPVAILLVLYLGINVYATSRRIGTWKDSETLWTDVLSKFPDADVAYKHRGLFYVNSKDDERAIADFLAFTRLRGDDAMVWLHLGNARGRRGENEKALEAYTISAKLNDRDPDLHANTGNILATLGRTDEALAAYSRSLAIDSLKADTYMNRGITYSRMQRLPEALADFDRALQLNPDQVAACGFRGTALRESGRFLEAIGDFDRAIQAEPKNDNFYLQRGVCNFQMNRLDAALADLDRCIALNPSNGNAWFDRAVIFSQQGKNAQAYEEASRAASLGFAVDPGFLASLKAKAGRNL